MPKRKSGGGEEGCTVGVGCQGLEWCTIGGGGGGQAGCLLRVEVIVKMQKSRGGGVRSGDRVARLGVVVDVGMGCVNQE